MNLYIDLFSKKKSLFLLLCIFAAVSASTLKLYTKASTESVFWDEEVYSDAAMSFFTQLEYSTPHLLNVKRFDKRVTSGLAVTWPAGLSLAFGGSRLTTRLIQSFTIQIFFLCLGIAFLRKFSLSWSAAICIVSLAWLSFLRLPYWNGLVICLGEIPAALWFGAGILYFRSSPNSSAILLGIASWLGKIFYLPYSAFILLAFFFQKQENFYLRIKKTFLYGLLFVSPFILWSLFVLIRSDLTFFLSWLRDYFDFLFNSNVSKTSSPLTISERLSTLEWSVLSVGTKFKIVFLFLGFIFGVFLEWRFFKEEFFKKNKYLFLALFLGVLLNYYYYFFLNPWMWMRYLQSALAVCFVFIWITFFRTLHLKAKNLSPYFISLGFLYSSLELFLQIRVIW